MGKVTAVVVGVSAEQGVGAADSRMAAARSPSSPAETETSRDGPIASWPAGDLLTSMV
jgi:hypothetical protein